MEFLRFGSSIPGSYWGCCCVDIIQHFSVDPDKKVAIEAVSGDGGNRVNSDTGKSFIGTTYREIFENRLRIGTFSTRDMPNHAFLAVITAHQLSYDGAGKKWLAILKEHGFEFIRTISNSVGAGSTLFKEGGRENASRNYLFGLFRNIGSGRITDPFMPPKEWTDLKGGKETVLDYFCDGNISGADLSRNQEVFDLAVWDRIGPANLITEKEAEAAGCEIHYAGVRSLYPQQTKTEREMVQKTDKNYVAPTEVVNPFGQPILDFVAVKGA